MFVSPRTNHEGCGGEAGHAGACLSSQHVDDDGGEMLEFTASTDALDLWGWGDYSLFRPGTKHGSSKRGQRNLLFWEMKNQRRVLGGYGGKEGGRKGDSRNL